MGVKGVPIKGNLRSFQDWFTEQVRNRSNRRKNGPAKLMESRIKEEQRACNLPHLKTLLLMDICDRKVKPI